MKTIMQDATEYYSAADTAKTLGVTYQTLYNWSKAIEELNGYQVFDRDDNTHSKMYSAEDIEKFKNFQHINKNTNITRNQALQQAFGDPDKKGDLEPSGGTSKIISEEAQLLMDGILKELQKSNERAEHKDALIEQSQQKALALSTDYEAIKKERDELLEQNKQLIESTKEVTAASKEAIETNKQLLEEINKSKAEGKKGFWSKLFG